MRFHFCAALLAALAAPLALTAQQAATDSAAIHALSRQFSALYVSGDAPAMAALYTPDAVIFPERSEMLVGREAIERYWTLRPDDEITRHVATPTRIRVEGDLAYDYGVYEVAGARDGEPWGPTRGKYVIVWRREPDGRWRIHLDIWNALPRPEP